MEPSATKWNLLLFLFLATSINIGCGNDNADCTNACDKLIECCDWWGGEEAQDECLEICSEYRDDWEEQDISEEIGLTWNDAVQDIMASDCDSLNEEDSWCSLGLPTIQVQDK